MHVVDNEPQFWFLLRDGDEFYLDLRVQASFVEYSALIPLTSDEKAEYAASGHAFMIALAEDLNYHVEKHRARDVFRDLGNRSHAVIMAWIAANPDAKR